MTAQLTALLEPAPGTAGLGRVRRVVEVAAFPVPPGRLQLSGHAPASAVEIFVPFGASRTQVWPGWKYIG